MIRVISFIDTPHQDQYKSNHDSNSNPINIYSTYYDMDVCVAECVRNSCVNMNIDPNTVNAIYVQL